MSLIIKLSFVATLFAHVAFGVTHKNILFSLRRYTFLTRRDRYMNISEITDQFVWKGCIIHHEEICQQ